MYTHSCKSYCIVSLICNHHRLQDEATTRFKACFCLSVILEHLLHSAQTKCFTFSLHIHAFKGAHFTKKKRHRFGTVLYGTCRLIYTLCTRAPQDTSYGAYKSPVIMHFTTERESDVISKLSHGLSVTQFEQCDEVLLALLVLLRMVLKQCGIILLPTKSPWLSQRRCTSPVSLIVLQS